MQGVATDNKLMIEDYLQALSGQAKTEALMDRFITDPALKEHIRSTETAFPRYELEAQQLVAEGDMVAMRATFRGTHRGVFAGIAPTGKAVSAELMLFYRLADGRIAEHWMQLDVTGLMRQLAGS